MKLVADWREIVKKAWSFRLILAAAFLSGLEVVFYLLGGSFGIVGIVASFIVSMGALIMRIVAQKEFLSCDTEPSP